MLDALIPLGSVVRVEGQEGLGFVLGFYPESEDQMYDYLLAPYPAGISNQVGMLLANADSITEVVSRGYLDERGEEILRATVDMMNAQEEAYVQIGKYLEEQGLTVGSDETFAME